MSPFYTALFDEMLKIADFMLPPSAGGSMPRLPRPAGMPHVDSSGAMGMNYSMHMPTVLAEMQKNQPAHVATGTIPAPAPAPGRLGGAMPQPKSLGAAAYAPTLRPQGFARGAGAAVGKATSGIVSKLKGVGGALAHAV